MAITADQIKQVYSGYQAWNDPASIVADYMATGGSGKGAAPYSLGKDAVTPPPAPAPGTTTTTTSKTSSQIDYSNPSSIMQALGTTSPAYQQAIDVSQQQLPLIQQRYQSLLDEINANLGAGVAGYQTAEKGQLGEARARSAAAGTYFGTTELGTESNIRQQTAQNIAILQNQASSEAEKAAAQANLDQLAVAKEIAGLGISQAEAERTGLKDVLDAMFQQKSLALQEQQVKAAAAKETAPKWTLQEVKPTGLLATLGIKQPSTVLVEQNTGQVIPVSPDGKIRLKDPQTGNVYQYSSPSDADFEADLNRGFVPI